LSRIRILNQELSRKIAAGEVIERPVSVVKELIENSIDAGSRKIRVHILQGGKSGIIVDDDGAGIDENELLLAISKHATSKISKEEDLDSILTLGYRGEALSSIASVSRLEIRSRTSEAKTGALLEADLVNSDTVSRKINCEPGTRIQVEDLFFNMPARRKFMGSARSEFRRISRLVKEFAILYPQIDFQVSHDNRTVFTSFQMNSRQEVIESIWGRDPEVRYVTRNDSDIGSECWYQPYPGKRLNLLIFINGRVVRDPVIRSAVNSSDAGISGNLAFFLTVPPEKVDVNIHPAKAEVRFRKNNEIFDNVRHTVQEIAGLSIQKSSFSFHSENPEMPFPARKFRGSEPEGSFPGLLNTRVASPESLFTKLDPDSKEEQPNAEGPEAVEFLGQMLAGYLVFETTEGLLLMDHHAAHERVNFEKIRKEFTGGIGKQSLSDLQMVPPSLKESIEEHEKVLSEAGFTFSQEAGALYIKEIPSFLNYISLGIFEVVRTLVYELENNESISCASDSAMWLKWADMACKRSIKLTNRIDPAEAVNLYKQLLKCDNSLFCPHGRPTLLVIPVSKLSREFGRE